MSKLNSIVFLIGLAMLLLGVKYMERHVKEVTQIVERMKGYAKMEEIVLENNKEIGAIKNYLSRKEFEESMK